MLELHGVNSFYGQTQVLRDVTLSVKEGQVVSLLGANGAGKTTTIRTIVGLNRSAANDIRFRGKSIAKTPPYEMVKLGIATVPERREIFSGMSVTDNLEMGAYVRSNPSELRRDKERVYELFPVLAQKRLQSGGTLSGGQQQMLAIGRALMSRPSLLLLDEPTLGLAPLLVKEIFRIVRQLNEHGLTVLLIEQNANQALNISEYAYVLENGRVALEGQSAVLKNDPKVQESYLGAI
jgi:branched-chain amino acid transport system ATP-binding protein